MKSLRNFFAASLKYPPNVEAPFISAKGSGMLAKRITEIAKENNIPIIENDIVANVLSIKEIGECIPECTWQAVAEVFAVIKSIEDKHEKHS